MKGKRLTKNFILDEFIISAFYNEKQQLHVWQSFYDDAENLLPTIQKLANQLQVLRDYRNRPIKINIAYRPLWWELKKNRSGLSKHVYGMAADIVMKNVTPWQTYKDIEYLINVGDMLQGGLGLYNSFVHYDIRKTKARWDYR